jgi:hypothetical protein
VKSFNSSRLLCRNRPVKTSMKPVMKIQTINQDVQFHGI